MVGKFRGKETILSQGDPAKNVLYIQEGGVKLTVVNTAGNKAVVAILEPSDFCRESCLGNQPVCMATTIAPATVMVIEKSEMLRVLPIEHAISDRFIAYMVTRNLQVEEDCSVVNRQMLWNIDKVDVRPRRRNVLELPYDTRRKKRSTGRTEFPKRSGVGRAAAPVEIPLSFRRQWAGSQ